ncbi:hypothetical protein JCM10207_003614 [Rhodosporidiobolus poonsookiae]
MAEAAQDDPLQPYTAVLEQLTEQPYSRPRLLDRIRLAQELQLDDEVDQAREALAAAYPLSEAEWTAWIDDKKDKLPAVGAVEDVDPFIDLMGLYRRANQDYLSIPLLVAFSQWIISSYYAAQGLAPPTAMTAEEEDATMQPSAEARKVGEPDQLMSVVFPVEDIRAVREEVLSRGGMHLSESSKLWTIWRDFEMDLLKLNPDADQLTIVTDLYLARLAVPHLHIAQTFSAYSSFVTRYDNDNYDEALPKANAVYSPAVKKSDERYVEEDKLSKAGFTTQAYLDYISWEREVKRPDIPLVDTLFERAVHDHPSDTELWETWVEFSHKCPAKLTNLTGIVEKAVRSVPGSATVWSMAMRAAEKQSLGAEAVEVLFQRAIATGLFAKDMDGTVALYQARTSFYRREMDRKPTEEGETDTELLGYVLGVLQEGVAAARKVHKKGDLQNRLEKWLIRVYERFHMVNEARALWEELTKAKPYSYALWYARADFETRVGDYKRAHEVYVAGCSAKGLDYPEYLIDAWVLFEEEYGNLADLEFTFVKSKRQRKALEKRRAREAEAAAATAAAAPSAAPQPDADSFIASAISAHPAAADAMVVEPAAESSTGKKRELEDADGEQDGRGKKVRIEEAAAEGGEQKRDREHSTVFAISPTEMSEDDVRTLFRDCGEIRSLKVKQIAGSTYAQIEFAERESVLAARTKDKKRINEQEVEVHLGWQSCLYVTNFPESFDKGKMEELFGKYGTIFDTRWPSKRFKNTRRFCYVQFAVPDHAQAALALHGTELEPGHKLSVLISDPSRKKSRTDTNANERELYIAGLARSTKETDLRKMFEPFGTVKGVRMPTDEKGQAKRFAFVEYEEQSAAQAALAMNNTELKKRHISVTIAQARAAGTSKASIAAPRRAESENRGIRVRGLVPGTDEAVIQQTFEKIAPVQAINYEVGSTEALVLFENAADVGKALMQRDSLTVDGIPVEILTEGRQTRPAAGGGSAAKKAAAGGDVPLMPRQASRGRGRVGLAGGRGGRGGRAGIGAGRSVAAVQAAAAGGEGAEQGASGAVAGGEAAAAAGAKSQDDFRAMLLKKK